MDRRPDLSAVRHVVVKITSIIEMIETVMWQIVRVGIGIGDVSKHI